MIQSKKSLTGFTIVELLIVVVVIAILAAITIVAYNGIASRATESGLKSELSGSAKLVQLYKASNGSFPSSTAQVNNGRGITPSQGVGYTYAGQANTFCLSATSSKSPNVSFFIRETGSIQSGTCGGVISCYEFNPATYTLVSYYYEENNNPANPECTDQYIIPSQINGVPVRVLANDLFYGRGGPGVVDIPNTVTTIGNSAFQETSITSLTIPNSVTTIGSYAFTDNLQLKNVVLPNSVTSVGAGAFSNNGIGSVTLSNSLTSISNALFAWNGIQSVTIPSSVTTIGYNAFIGNSLTSLTIPTSVTSIGSAAFQENQLTTVYIPTATSVHASAFDPGVTIVRY